MALWNRLNQSRLKLLSNQFKRSCFQVHYGSSLDYIPKTSKQSLLENPSWIHKRAEFCVNIRSFASQHQGNNANEPRLNDQIEAPFIRLVTDEGHRVVSTLEALEQAKRLKLDLVEVQRNSDPPVCKMMDFHKEKYKQKVKEKDRAKSKSEVTLKKAECKEIRFSGKTEHKDLKMKADMVKRLMESGYRVKCVALGQKKKVSHKPFRKKVSIDDESTEGLGDDEDALEKNEEEKFQQELQELLSQLTALIEDVAVIESGPRVEKRQAYVIVKHVKFGLSKKGGAKKSKDVQTTQVTTRHSGPIDDDAAQSDDESEDQLSVEENDLPDEYQYTGRTPLSVDSTNGRKSAGINFVKNDTELQARHRNFNVSNLSHLGPVNDSKQADGIPPSTLKPSHGPENRYKRAEPRTGFSQISKDSRPSDRRDSFRFDQRFSNERRQPQPGTNGSPSIGERRSTGNYSSAFRNTNLHPSEVHKPEPEHPSSSYGVFSSPSSREGRPYSSGRDANRGGAGANTNSPGSQVDNGPRKWGIFSRDSPN